MAKDDSAFMLSLLDKLFQTNEKLERKITELIDTNEELLRAKADITELCKNCNAKRTEWIIKILLWVNAILLAALGIVNLDQIIKYVK